MARRMLSLAALRLGRIAASTAADAAWWRLAAV